MRGDGLFYDVMDRPETVAEFLRLLTDSILEFHAFRCRVLDQQIVSPNAAGMCDDVASAVPPRLFPAVVLPAWEQYFAGMTTGKRRAHVEDLRAGQLRFLEDIGLVYFDPSISPQINPGIIRDACRVPFGWRLGSFHYRSLSCEDVADFVFQAAADGASRVFTFVAASMCNEHTLRKVQAFIAAGREVERMLSDGADREAVGRCVRERGRTLFWDHWPE
jgi:hypothetical protein